MSKGEYDRLIEGLARAWRRFPGGVYCLWYPIKKGAPIAAFFALLTSWLSWRLVRVVIVMTASNCIVGIYLHSAPAIVKVVHLQACRSDMLFGQHRLPIGLPLRSGAVALYHPPFSCRLCPSRRSSINPIRGSPSAALR